MDNDPDNPFASVPPPSELARERASRVVGKARRIQAMVVGLATGGVICGSITFLLVVGPMAVLTVLPEFGVGFAVALTGPDGTGFEGVTAR